MDLLQPPYRKDANGVVSIMATPVKKKSSSYLARFHLLLELPGGTRVSPELDARILERLRSKSVHRSFINLAKCCPVSGSVLASCDVESLATDDASVVGTATLRRVMPRTLLGAYMHMKPTISGAPHVDAPLTSPLMPNLSPTILHRSPATGETWGRRDSGALTCVAPEIIGCICEHETNNPRGTTRQGAAFPITHASSATNDPIVHHSSPKYWQIKHT